MPVNEEQPKSTLITDLGFNYFHSFIFFTLTLSLGLILNLFELVQWTEALPPGSLAYHLNRWANGMVANPFLKSLQEPRLAVREIGQQAWLGDLMSSDKREYPNEKRQVASLEVVAQKAVQGRSEAGNLASGLLPAERFLFAGDSMLGSALQFKIKSFFVHDFKGAKAYKIMAKSGTGLTKPNLYNWNEVIPKELASSPVDLLVLFIGTNDNGHIRFDGHAYTFGGKKWDVAYGKRMHELVEKSCEKVRHVLWVNQMPMADHETDLKMKHINELAKSIVASTSCGIYVDIHDWLSVKGDFIDHLAIADEEGRVREVKIRNNDGVHLTDAGARIVTTKLVAFLKTRKLIQP